VSWWPQGDPFEASVAYTATMTLSAKDGWSFIGVSENFFTVEGTSSPATNNVDSCVVAAVFPVTGL